MSERELGRLADDMVQVLETQRRAMARLDVEALLDCNARTQSLLTDLGAGMAELERPSTTLRDKVTRVSIEAEANALLVKDTLEVIRGLMGAEASARGVYDARGAMQSSDRGMVARSI